VFPAFPLQRGTPYENLRKAYEISAMTTTTSDDDDDDEESKRSGSPR